jgi:hypothetical protein
MKNIKNIEKRDKFYLLLILLFFSVYLLLSQNYGMALNEIQSNITIDQTNHSVLIDPEIKFNESGWAPVIITVIPPQIRLTN